MTPDRSPKRRRAIREVGIVAVAYFAYFGVRGLTEGGLDRALANARAIVDLEERLGLFVEPTLHASIVGYHWAVNLANWVYLFGHWPVIVIVGAWLYRYKWPRYQYYRTAVLLSGTIGLVIFMLYPVAPPRLFGPAFVDTVTEYSNLYHVLQPSWLTNQLAALPSLHFGWNLLIGIVLVREVRNPVVRVVGAITPLIMGAAIVLTANHYLIDIVGGGGVALIGLALATRLNGLGRWPRLGQHLRSYTQRASMGWAFVKAARPRPSPPRTASVDVGVWQRPPADPPAGTSHPAP